jgi:hypothetical protein
MKENKDLPELFVHVEGNNGSIGKFIKHTFCPICEERLQLDERSLPRSNTERIAKDDYATIHMETIRYRLKLYCPNCHTTVELNEVSQFIFTVDRSNGEFERTVL